MDVISIIIGLLIGIAIGYLVAHSKNAAAETRVTMLTQQIAKLEEDANKQKEELQANYQQQLQDQRQQQAEQQTVHCAFFQSNAQAGGSWYRYF